MREILKQTSWLFLAQTFGRIIGFFYTIFLAKNLGVSDFGLYSAAIAYFSLASSIADFGFNRFLIREVARDHFKIPQLLCNISMLRLALTSILFAVLAITLYLLDPDKLRVSLILLAILTVLPQSISLTIDAIFVAIQKLQYSSLAIVALNLSTTFLGIYLVSAGFGPVGAITALILGQLIYLLVLAVILKTQKITLLSQVNLSIFKEVIKGSLPYGLLGILGLLYFRVDLIILNYLKGNFEAGIYGAAYKFLEAIVFVPGALATALFPVLAKLHDKNSDKISPIYFKSIKIMGLLGVMIAVGYVLLLPVLIKIFLPSYILSVQVIRILALAIPFMFIHIPGAQVLLSTDKYLKPIFYLSILTLFFNVILNFIFIPLYGFIAAAWVTVASEVFTLLIFFQLLRRKVLHD